MNIAICDDNNEYLNVVQEYLDEIKKDKVKFTYDVFESGEELVGMYDNAAEYDAIFLDMEMKKLDGIETANLIRKVDRHVIIVFVTSHEKYMHRSFQCEPFRFLIKPISCEDFKNTFNEVLIKLKNNRSTFVFKENRATIRLFCEDIIYLENQSHWVYIYTKKKMYRVCMPFYEVHKELDDRMFCKIHRSFIINLDYVKEIGENSVNLYACDQQIPLSRSYQKDLESNIMRFKERKYLL